jgi:hypothetical protein
VHSSQHASNELVNTITFLHQGHQCGDPALIVSSGLEVGKDKLLEGINLILQGHEIGDGLVAISSLASDRPIPKVELRLTLH